MCRSVHYTKQNMRKTPLESILNRKEIKLYHANVLVSHIQSQLELMHKVNVPCCIISHSDDFHSGFKTNVIIISYKFLWNWDALSKSRQNSD